MTLVAGRVPVLHGLDRRTFRDDSSMPGILKSGPTHIPNKNTTTFVDKPAPNNQRNEDSKRLVRFSETEEREEIVGHSRDDREEDQEVIMLGSNMYFVNNPDPNSAVRKLFPNSKLTPINPVIKQQSKPFNTIKRTPLTMKPFETNHNTINRTRSSKSDSEESGNLIIAKRKMDNNTLRRSMLKVSPENKPKQKLGKAIVPPTPLIERIKRLTCESDDKDILNNTQEEDKISKELPERTIKLSDTTQLKSHEPNVEHNSYYHNKGRDLPKLEKDGLNMLRCNENIKQLRSQNTTDTKQLSPTDEARRSFLSSLSQQNEGEAGDRNSVATISTTADTVYSISDIEDALTEEEKEIKDAFAHEIKQDELELFVQQDAGRTERIRKRYSTTPKPENAMPMLFSNNNYPQINSDFQNYSNNTLKKDKPKFGSTIEILQQLQQQIEIPYQLEGRRTACSNYSDSSIPISDRLFCDESSDGYEPVLPKLNTLRSCSLDSKNYEEIDNFPSAFSVLRTKSQEHPRMTHFDSDTHFYPPSSVRHSAHFSGSNHLQEQSLYTSSPDLHRFYNTTVPDRYALYNNHTTNGRQLHPVLQRQYCRYPANEVSQRHSEEEKVLTPPSRMHTYMNVPVNAPCYLSPPPYSKTNHYTNSPPNNSYGNYIHSNVYQNVPPPTNHHLMTLRRLCTEKERGVPEGASSSQDSKESYSPKDYCPRPSITTIPKTSNLPHQYCVDV